MGYDVYIYIFLLFIVLVSDFIFCSFIRRLHRICIKKKGLVVLQKQIYQKSHSNIQMNECMLFFPFFSVP